MRLSAYAMSLYKSIRAMPNDKNVYWDTCRRFRETFSRQSGPDRSFPIHFLAPGTPCHRTVGFGIPPAFRTRPTIRALPQCDTQCQSMSVVLSFGKTYLPMPWGAICRSSGFPAFMPTLAAAIQRMREVFGDPPSSGSLPKPKSKGFTSAGIDTGGFLWDLLKNLGLNAFTSP